ncbi:MAG: NADH-quinone oxidoreductase subunit C [Candidatus Firestonebacteria bacterium]
MNYNEFKKVFIEKSGFTADLLIEAGEEIYIKTNSKNYLDTCLLLHKELSSPVMIYFAEDNTKSKGVFTLYCGFLGKQIKKWVFAVLEIDKAAPEFPSISEKIVSSQLFEREIKEMFGLIPVGSPDGRRLRLHEEVWPEGFYPLRKDFVKPGKIGNTGKEYLFDKIEGEGVFEVPVGPVHAGIIGPGHFRFSVAGEPIINLEIRLGFTHRGVEKLFEGRNIKNSLKLAECVSGDSAFAQGLAFTLAVEKACNVSANARTKITRGICLELERLYNHVNDIGGMAIDVSFSYPSALASLIKENILRLNEKLTNHRYLKGINAFGRCELFLDSEKQAEAHKILKQAKEDLKILKEMLFSSVSFMDRVDTTGLLQRKTAEDFGITGLAARAAGIKFDLRTIFPGVYLKTSFMLTRQEKGDVLARLNVRFDEIAVSLRMIKEFIHLLSEQAVEEKINPAEKEGVGLGFCEGFRGPVLYWVKLDKEGKVERCKIVDASFNNWQGLSYSVLGNIVPDFPLCNKSFDLSYPGGDL